MSNNAIGLVSVTIALPDDRNAEVIGEKVTEHFALVPQVTIDSEGRASLSEYGRSLTHIRTGRAVAYDTWYDLRRYARELEATDIDWGTIESGTLTADQTTKIVEARRRAMDPDDTSEWPWPKWAGDETQPALSLLATMLDSVVEQQKRFDAIRDVEASVATLDADLGRKIGSELLVAWSGLSTGEFGVAYLLAVLRRIDPAGADLATRQLVSMWEDGGSVGEFAFQWRQELAEGRPLALHGFPHQPFADH
ncbi:hypothetical protein [Nocardia sp. NPDC059239]|uniref:hypothetical protein n=1 Tax=unclassified Nocardia TaxID=2637762 RepID=UPI0036C2C1F5